jgi:hypothetical protein
MYLLAWTINHGQNNLIDHQIIVDEQQAVAQWVDSIQTQADVHCWAACNILEASEPHWMESGD